MSNENHDINIPTSATALRVLMPDGGWWGESGGQFFCDDGLTLPTEEAIQAKLTELKASYNAQEYARNRQAEYPTVEELTIAQYDAADKAALVTKRAAVKTKWPKDNSGPIE